MLDIYNWENVLNRMMIDALGPPQDIGAVILVDLLI